MDTDDQPIGRVLSRREALSLLAAASAAMLTGCGPGAGTATTSAAASAASQASAAATEAASLNAEAATAVATTTANPGAAATGEALASTGNLPTCIVSPAQTEGPYYADVQLDRSDIRADSASGDVKPGAPLDLTLRVSEIGTGGCVPLAGAVVEIWHCDADGVYSAFAREGTANETFLRGYQTTGADGAVLFRTIYPGWYRGRTIHIHFKVHTNAQTGSSFEFVSQLYFDDAVSDQVLARPPYNARGGARSTTNADDGIFRDGGDQLMVTVTPAGEGYAGTFDIGLNLAGSQQPQGPGNRPPGGPGGSGGPPPA